MAGKSLHERKWLMTDEEREKWQTRINSSLTFRIELPEELVKQVKEGVKA